MSDNGNNPFVGNPHVPTSPAFGKIPAVEEAVAPTSMMATEELNPASEATEPKQETPMPSEEAASASLEKPALVSELATEQEEKALSSFMQSPETPRIEQPEDNIFAMPEDEALEEDVEENAEGEGHYPSENAAAEEESSNEQEPRGKKKTVSRIIGLLLVLGVTGAGVYFSGLLDSDPVPTLPLKAANSALPSTPAADALPPVVPQQTNPETLSAPVAVPATPPAPVAPSAPAPAVAASPVIPAVPAAAPAPAVVQESAKEICEKHMTEYAQQNHADANAYIAQNPDYVKQCIDQVQAWQDQQKKK